MAPIPVGTDLAMSMRTGGFDYGARLVVVVCGTTQHLPRYIDTAGFDGSRVGKSEHGLIMSTVPKGHAVRF